VGHIAILNSLQKTKVLFSPGNQTLIHSPAHSLVHILIELFWLPPHWDQT